MRSTRFLLSVCLAGLLLSSRVFAHPLTNDMATAASTFLAALTPEQRSVATYPLTDRERENWNFVPTKRNGLPLKQMSAEQRPLALALLHTALSNEGYGRAEAIMALENVLRDIENDPVKRDPAQYFVTVFGTPSESATWGWRFEGHHVAFNFTVVDGKHLFFTPSFLGTNPAEVRSGPQQGKRVLREEDDLGRAFLRSLDEQQRKIAVIETKAPSEVITSNRPRAQPLTPVGITAAQLNASQRAALIQLAQLYLKRWKPEIADSAWAEASKDGTDLLSFAWAGGFERGEGNYYRIQSPTFLIEFDNTQNHANHIHTAVRVFKGDFGHDLLTEHYAKEHTK